MSVLRDLESGMHSLSAGKIDIIIHHTWIEIDGTRYGPFNEGERTSIKVGDASIGILRRIAPVVPSENPIR